MSDSVGGAGGWVLSVDGVLSSRVAAGAAVSGRGDAGVVDPIGVSVCCDRGSVDWARVGDNSFGVDVVAASFGEVNGEGLSGLDFGVTGAPVFGASAVMRSVERTV